MSFFFLVWVFKSPEMWCGRRVLHFAIFFHSTPPHPLSFFPPVLHFAPGSRPLCDGSSDSGKRSTGIPGWHTGPTGAKKNVRCGSYRATEKGSRFSNHPMSVFTQVLTGWLAVSAEKAKRFSLSAPICPVCYTDPYSHSCRRHIC